LQVEELQRIKCGKYQSWARKLESKASRLAIREGKIQQQEAFLHYFNSVVNPSGQGSRLSSSSTDSSVDDQADDDYDAAEQQLELSELIPGFAAGNKAGLRPSSEHPQLQYSSSLSQHQGGTSGAAGSDEPSSLVFGDLITWEEHLSRRELDLESEKLSMQSQLTALYAQISELTSALSRSKDACAELEQQMARSGAGSVNKASSHSSDGPSAASSAAEGNITAAWPQVQGMQPSQQQATSSLMQELCGFRHHFPLLHQAHIAASAQITQLHVLLRQAQQGRVLAEAALQDLEGSQKQSSVEHELTACQTELEDAQQQMADAQQQLAELADCKQQMADAQQELAQCSKELCDAKQQATTGRAQMDALLQALSGIIAASSSKRNTKRSDSISRTSAGAGADSLAAGTSQQLAEVPADAGIMPQQPWTSQLRTIQQGLRSAVSVADKGRRQQQELSSELRTSKQQLASATKQVQAHRRALAVAAAQAAEMKARASSLEGQVANKAQLLELSNQQLQAMQQQAADLQQELTVLQQHAKQHQASQQAMIKQHQKQLCAAEAAAAAKAADGIKHKLQEAKKQCASLQQHLRAAHERRREAEQALQTSTSQLSLKASVLKVQTSRAADAEQETGNLREEVDFLRKLHVKHNMLEEVRRLEEQFVKKERSNVDLHALNQKMQDCRDELVATRQQYLDVISSQQQRASADVQQSDAATQTIEEQKQDSSSDSDSSSAISTEQLMKERALRDQLARTQQQMQALQEEVQRATMTLTCAAQQHQDQSDRLLGELRSMATEREELKQLVRRQPAAVMSSRVMYDCMLSQ
jgi:chromosome segregation ATPase